MRRSLCCAALLGLAAAPALALDVCVEGAYPPFSEVTADGTIECHEVKGGYALHSHQRARLAFDQARVEFPFRWVWAVRGKQGWNVRG